MFTNKTTTTNMSNLNFDIPNFKLLWDDDSPKEQQETQVREITSEELEREFGIDPSIFEEDFTEQEGPNSLAPGSISQEPSTCQFIDISETYVGEFIENESSKGTLKKTLSDVRKFEQFLRTKKEEKELNEIDPERLDQYLATFILAIRKSNGEEYEPTTLRNIISSIDRKLKRHKYPHKIIDPSTNHFHLCREALKAKQKSLKRQGKGNRPNRAIPLTDDEIDMLYSKAVLGGSNPKSLINVVWLNNCIMFGLRGTKENYNPRWGDIKLKKGHDGIQYLEYCSERQTKTRTGEKVNDIRPVNPKIFATPEDTDRCPVGFYKLYASKRPSDFCAPNDPFYLAPRTTSQRHVELTWFMKMNVGEKKLGSLMKSMATDAGLDGKKRILMFNPYSAVTIHMLLQTG